MALQCDLDDALTQVEELLELKAIHLSKAEAVAKARKEVHIKLEHLYPVRLERMSQASHHPGYNEARGAASYSQRVLLSN